jgi:hypothetical protein
MKVIVNNPEVYERNLEIIKAIKKSLCQTSKISNDVEKEKYGDNSVTGIVIISG